MMRNVLTLAILLGINAAANAVPSKLDVMGSSSAVQLFPTMHSADHFKPFSFDTVAIHASPALTDAAVSAAHAEASEALNQAAMLDANGYDKSLMLFAALGLIVLQLRRKHKSLSQRPIVNASVTGPIAQG